MTRVGDVDVYFLRLEDCERLDAPQMTVNRRGLIASTVFAMTAYRVTALNQVSVLLAGECMELQQDRHTLKRYWNPLEVAQTDLIEDQQEAERLTRATVSTCVHAWASCFDTILHRLSGGLDSTIVLACLKDAPNRPYVVCENYYGSAGSQFDERAFARLTARHAGFELIETPLRGEDYFEIRQTLRSSPDPYPCEPMEGDMRRIAELMRARSVPGMFHGHGGDELFFRFGKFPTVADFLYSHRLFLKAARIAFDDSAVIKAPLWRIARSAVIWGLLRRRWNYRDDYRRDLRKYPALVDEIVPEHVWNEVFGDDSVWHPLYLHDIANLPPGKAYQCYLISMAAEARSAPPPDEPDLPIKISPLLSQPFIELSLRTPLYVLRAGGRDRAIARRAFRDQIPAAILERRSKGGGNDLLQSALRRNIASVRQRLVNGRLVQLGYLDGRKLADVLALDSPTRLKVYPAAIWRHFMNEVWLERWPSDALAAAC
jgi:asparagine synthase (glutamine-hydrolysing)